MPAESNLETVSVAIDLNWAAKTTCYDGFVMRCSLISAKMGNGDRE